MAWFLRFTRFLDAHAVYAQEAQNSCGIASVMMCVFKLKKLRPGAHAVTHEREIDRVYSRVAHTHYDGSAYTYANHLAGTLNHLRVGHWHAKYIGPNAIAREAMSRVGVVGPGPHIGYEHGHGPLIVLVGWNAGGAHFVVIDTVVDSGGKKYATVCDPWDGNVHVTEIKGGQAFNYHGAHVPWSWDLGGTRHEYATPSDGVGNGWVVHRHRGHH
jgi:hypothetical protein